MSENVALICIGFLLGILAMLIVISSSDQTYSNGVILGAKISCEEVENRKEYDKCVKTIFTKYRKGEF